MSKKVSKKRNKKSKKQDRKQEYDVIVVYNGYDSALDWRLRGAADEAGAEDIGSGFGFGCRDHQFRFSTKSTANKFARQVRRWKAIKDLNGYADMVVVECFDCDKVQSECVCG